MNGQKEYKYSVTGRVVDGQGQPVQERSFTWTLTFGHIKIFGFTTGHDGRFHLEEETAVPRETIRLYVTDLFHEPARASALQAAAGSLVSRKS